MEQLISIFKNDDKREKYIEYKLTADEYDLINYFYATVQSDELGEQLWHQLKELKNDKIINMGSILELGKQDIYKRRDLVEMVKGYLSCYKIESTFELNACDLSRFHRSMSRSNIVSDEDIQELESSIEAARNNTNVLNRFSIDLESLELRENLEKDIIQPVIYEIPSQKQKRTS